MLPIMPMLYTSSIGARLPKKASWSRKYSELINTAMQKMNVKA